MLEQRRSERVKLGYKQVGVIRVDESRMQESHPGFATATQSHPHIDRSKGHHFHLGIYHSLGVKIKHQRVYKWCGETLSVMLEDVTAEPNGWSSERESPFLLISREQIC